MWKVLRTAFITFGHKIGSAFFLKKNTHENRNICG